MFVTGEPGIGKTTLVEEFLFGVRSAEEFGVEETEESQKSKGKSQKYQTSPQPRASSPEPRSSSVAGNVSSSMERAKPTYPCLRLWGVWGDLLVGSS